MSDNQSNVNEESENESSSGVGRRGFLKGIGLTTALGMTGSAVDDKLTQLRGIESVDDADYIGNYPYREWEDFYRQKWEWDSVARSTHGVNCTGSCSWNVYVKNGQVWREEQASDYPEINDELPSSNPRGCQKGACYTDYVNAEQRVKHPLKRVGERGEGKWKRISWDEALTEIADKITEEVTAGRYDTISGFTPIPAMSPVSFASGSRLINLFGGVSHSFYDWYCDLPPGQPITWGVQTDNAESADWYNADYIIAWGSNINISRIPDAKFFLEAAYNGTKRVGIFSDYSQTAIHCDEWLAPDPGSDIALALGMARTIVDEELYDEAHLKEQSDMPLLVREDTGKFLRASDVSSDGNDQVFMMVDGSGGLRRAPGSLGNREGKYDPDASIELDFDPRLAVDRRVQVQNKNVRVRSVWTRLQKELSKYTPDRVYEITGVGRETYQKIAREFGNADRAKIIQGKGVNDWYHNDLGNRALQLLVTLTGNLGRQGTGLDHYVGQEKIWTLNGWQKLAFPTGDVRGVATALWTYYHAGILGNVDEATADRIRTSIEKGWMPMYPEQREGGNRPPPSTMFIWRGNYLNQSKGGLAIQQGLWPKLDLVVDVNFRMDSSALYSDIVLPAASHYEKYDLSMTDMHSYVHPFTPAIEPLGQSKTDWEIFRLLAQKIQELATERNIEPIDDRKFDRQIDLQSIHDDYVRDWLVDEPGALREDKAAAEFILEHSEETNPEGTDDQITFDETVEHPQRFLATGDHWTSPIEKDKPYTPWKRFVQGKEPWPTLTGRQQYYIDHDWFLDLGEELPTHKDPMTLQNPEEYPLRYNTPHSRWAIHSTWRANDRMLRLQRGEPVVWLNPEDAKKRNIEDGDDIIIYNEIDTLNAMAKIYPSSEPGTVRMYFGWERFQFETRGNFNTLTSMYMKPTQLVQYPEDTAEHLYFFPNYWGPTGVNSDVRVEVQPVQTGGGETTTPTTTTTTPEEQGGTSGTTTGETTGANETATGAPADKAVSAANDVSDDNGGDS
ncbi:nitrate reductase subunit alpha [Haladaptatus sp. NG-WS-4]